MLFVDGAHAFDSASTAPAHRRSIRLSPNPRPAPLRPCPDCARAGAPQPRDASPPVPLGLHRQLVCPWNRFAATAAEPGFAPRHRLDRSPLVELFAWDEADFYGRVPAGSVVVPGSLPASDGSHSLACAVIVKRVDAKTRARVGLNELLRDV